jgi:hypothetical protein
MHTNGLDHDPVRDLIVLSLRNLNEIWVIDHSTTTEEAKGSKGGKQGKGGDLLMRWGNPQAWGAGEAKDQRLSGQHDAQFIPARATSSCSTMAARTGLPKCWRSPWCSTTS